MQIELFSLAQVDDRETFDDLSHHMTERSTRRKDRPGKGKRSHTQTINTI